MLRRAFKKIKKWLRRFKQSDNNSSSRHCSRIKRINTILIRSNWLPVSLFKIMLRLITRNCF